jgi:hypothetical protein
MINAKAAEQHRALLDQINNGASPQKIAGNRKYATGGLVSAAGKVQNSGSGGQPMQAGQRLGGNVNMTVVTQDARSFNRSQNQIAIGASRAIQLAQKRNG